MNQENETQKNSTPESETQAENKPEQQAAPAREPEPDETKSAQPAETEAEKPEEAQTAETGEEKKPEEKAGRPEEKKGKAPQHSMKKYFHSAKFRHGSVATAISVGFVVIIVLVNIVVGILGDKFPSMNVDLTKNSVNTLSEDAVKVVDSVKTPTTIYILATKDQVMNNSLYSGVQYDQVGILSAKIQERNSNISVEYVDLDKNPTFANDYQSDNLTTGNVVVKSDKRYRVLSYTDLFKTQYSSDYSSTKTYSNVNSALTSALNAVNSDTLPVVAFDTGHDEMMDMTYYKKLLSNNSFDTRDFDLLTDEIPEDTQMIVLGCPNTDYTQDEIQKLDDFLSDTALKSDRSLMITFYPSQITMPNLTSFLKEWGLGVSQAVVVESDQSKKFMNSPTYIVSDVQTGLTLNESSTDYGVMLTPQSVPIDLVYTGRGSRATYSLLKSSDTCYLVDNNTQKTDTPQTDTYNTAAISRETLKGGDGDYHYTNVIALGSSTMFAEQILDASTYGDGKYILDLSKYATGTTNSATEISIMPQETNVADITLDSGKSNLLGVGVFMLLIPLAVAVCGIVVYRRRRNL